ncbi:alcohol dehydrogenase [Parafrankia colletiae]|uniref:Alcohol dehydrogenase n=1 Tax=Parafrankia colletiae TaxID=573497 RepID=A0A1S1R3F4_9ACTN|nr:alcohol dehydrogenase catalytic domain-containing protein [Parafrankia colletiae]MCK9900199.1 alcohol dehydrogenase catalytic domain-containing protein [Frankia sp. Cpl3]OHV40251.1 alcohol dehydrogenase [Parafrankia colletiae]
MRAAVVVPGGQYEITEVADPSPGPGELLLRVTACGFCGSDLKARDAMPAGTIMGHEFAGEIVGIGTDVSAGAGADMAGWRVGTHVAVLPALSCGRCEWCATGHVIHCPRVRLVGLGGTAGAFAELAVVTAAAAFPLPPEIDPRHGALVEPFAVGLHCVRTGRLEPGEDVLVVGSGAVGLTTIAWARARGAGRITAVDPAAIRRAAAESFGATDVLTSVDQAEAGAYHLVVECAGRAGLLDACVTAARPRGRIVLAGVTIEATPFQSWAALMKEVSVGFAVYYTPEEFRTVVAAFGSGLIDPAPLLARRVELAQVNEAFDALARTAASAKILVEP